MKKKLYKDEFIRTYSCCWKYPEGSDVRVGKVSKSNEDCFADLLDAYVRGETTNRSSRSMLSLGLFP